MAETEYMVRDRSYLRGPANLELPGFWRAIGIRRCRSGGVRAPVPEWWAGSPHQWSARWFHRQSSSGGRGERSERTV